MTPFRAEDHLLSAEEILVFLLDCWFAGDDVDKALATAYKAWVRLRYE